MISYAVELAASLKLWLVPIVFQYLEVLGKMEKVKGKKALYIQPSIPFTLPMNPFNQAILHSIQAKGFNTKNPVSQKIVN
jgi:hypothetical protein